MTLELKQFNSAQQQIQNLNQAKRASGDSPDETSSDQNRPAQNSAAGNPPPAEPPNNNPPPIPPTPPNPFTAQRSTKSEDEILIANLRKTVGTEENPLNDYDFLWLLIKNPSHKDFSNVVFARACKFDPMRNYADFNFSGAQLELADFTKCNLRSVNFSGANLTRAIFGQETSAIQTNFANANLSYASFEAANLNGANFSGANTLRANFIALPLRKANFDGAKLEEVSFYRASLGQSSFKDVDLRGASFVRSSINKTQFSNADMRGATLIMVEPSADTEFKQVDLSNSLLKTLNWRFVKAQDLNIDGARMHFVEMPRDGIEGNPTMTTANDFSHANLRNIDVDGYIYNIKTLDFTGSDLTAAIITGEICDASFKNSVLHEALFNNPTFENCNFTNANLHDSKFKGSKLVNCNFKNANLMHVYAETSTLFGGEERLRPVELDIQGCSFENAYFRNHRLYEMNDQSVSPFLEYLVNNPDSCKGARVVEMLNAYSSNFDFEQVDLDDCNPAIQAIYDAGIRYVAKNDFSNLNLNGSRLGMMLRMQDSAYEGKHQKDFRDADFSGSSMQGAALDACTLAGAKLTNVDLTRAFLHGAILSHMDLGSTNLSDARCDSNTNFSYSVNVPDGFLAHLAPEKKMRAIGKSGRTY